MPIELEIEEEICEARCVATADLEVFTDHYELDTDQWISDIMSHLPFRSIIDKEETANGATRRFMKQLGFKINVLPLKPSVVKLANEYSDSKAVHGEIDNEPSTTVEDCLEYLLGLDSIDKASFVCVPESVTTIIKAINKYNQITWESPIDLKDIAVLFDEFHLVTTETTYRKSLYQKLIMLTGMFPKLSLVSATPVEFSDPFLNNHFRRVTIRRQNQVSPQIITIVAESLLPSLIKVLREKMVLPGEIFLYLNYVEYMRQVTHIIQHEFPNKTSLYFNPNDKKHKVTLKEFYSLLVPENSNQPPNKLNIYTSRGNASWGVEVKDSVIIFATDINISSCIENVGIQGKQWLGRPRKNFPAKELIHITTVDESLGKKHKAEDFIKNALYSKELYQRAEKDECGDDEFKKNHLDNILKSSSINHSKKSNTPNLPLIAVSEEGVVDIEYNNLDYHIYRSKTNSQYLNSDTVEKAWKDCGAVPVVESCDKTWDLEDKKLKRKSTGARANLRTIVNIFHDLRAFEGTDLKRDAYKKCVEDYPEVRIWYTLLGIKPFEENNYSYDKVKKIYTAERDKKIMLSLEFSEAVYERFQCGRVYTNKEITNGLLPIKLKFEVERTLFSKDIKLYFNTPAKAANTKKDQLPLNGWKLISRKYNRIVKD